MTGTTGSLVRRLAWASVFFAGCVLPDYSKVDESGAPAGSDAGSGAGASSGPSAGDCCGGESCTEPEVADCVCGGDSFCCEGWDASCAAQVEELGCGSCSGPAADPEPGQSCGAVVCDASAPLCADETCVQCVDDNDCAEHFPDLPVCIEGDCGECHQDSDCDALFSGEYPYCIGGLCAECLEDADCASNTCVDGTCE